MIVWSVDDPLRTNQYLLRMDPIDLETRRLLMSAVLTAQARRRVGKGIPAGSNVREPLELARRLNEGADPIERAYRLRFEPSYPGVTAGPHSVGGTCRLLLGCVVNDTDGNS